METKLRLKMSINGICNTENEVEMKLVLVTGSIKVREKR